MARDLSEITNPDELLDQIATLRDEKAAIAATIREQVVRAVSDLDANHSRAARAAGISRPTLYAWLSTGQES